jgi:hypothetical protein
MGHMQTLKKLTNQIQLIRNMYKGKSIAFDVIESGMRARKLESGIRQKDS